MRTSTFVSLLSVVVLPLALVSTSWAAHVSCGDVITSNTTLDGNVGPCATDPAIEVQGSAMLDLNGFTVSCMTTATVGISLTGKGAKLRNGVVEGCNDGVRLLGTGGHKVERVLSTQNQFNGFRSGDDSHKNKLDGNSATDNGDDGFEISGDGVTLTNNTSTSNSDRGFNINGTAEGLKAQGNTAARNSGDGFGIFGTEHKVFKNTSQQNGDDGYEFGVSSGHTVKLNRAYDNASHGIENRATDSTFQKNTVLGHSTDIFEVDPFCDNNSYSKNSFGTATQTCVE